ncbi:uncharacterized protein LOC130711057 [Lotus japonicus]|uniref:uncharacterized protein LOC130711057 n=1 Tax=Lotus japonicus TaxID=34305 RepID=UPI00258606B0|nr:uncharacterized protein LOC130711057 [Lotus japonicus]
MATSRRLFNFCSLLMATLFMYSASVQLNDPDWYFWFPLYSCASLINITNCIMITTKLNRLIAKTALWIGILLYLKVVVEDFVYGIAGFWSLDLSKRVVREKIGSVLVVLSTFLQMEASKFQNDPQKNREKDVSSIVKHGMLILVVFSYMLPFVFFVVLKAEMEF